MAYVNKEYGMINRGDEELYNPQLDYIEHKIYEVYCKNPISDYDLQIVIPIVIYDLKEYIDNKVYDYKEIVDENIINFAKELEMLFNPFINKNIKINNDGKNNLKELFTLPIICLVRIYDSIDFWRGMYGKDGYYKILEEMVMPIKHLGQFPFALNEKFLIED